MIIHGIKGAGKSFLVGQLAQSLATGEPFIGFNVIEPVKVIVFDYEMTELLWRELREPVTGVLDMPPEAQARLFYHWDPPPMHGKDDDEILGTLFGYYRDVVRNIAADVIIIDPLRVINIGGEAETTWLAKFANAALSLARDLNIAIVFVHHSPKASAKSKTRGGEAHLESRGHGSITDPWATVLTLKPKGIDGDNGEEQYTEREADAYLTSRLAPGRKMQLLFGDGRWHRDDPSDTLDPLAGRLVVALRQQGPMSGRQCAKAAGVSWTTAHRRLKPLVASGHIHLRDRKYEVTGKL